jgi:hypothetical protein
VLAASDFLTGEVWTGRGLITHYLLFVISLADRVVNVAGITTRPDDSWMIQIGRNVTDAKRRHEGTGANAFVSTGTCLTPVPVVPGDEVWASYSAFGELLVWPT